MNRLSNFLKDFTQVSAKPFFVLFFILGSLSATFAQNSNATDKQGALTYYTEEIDYGQIVQDDNGERIFKFSNTGDAAVVISDVKTSCGCTVPTYPKTPILPGETGEIKVKYDTHRTGAFTKTITVMSNTSEPTKILKIKGNISKSENK